MKRSKIFLGVTTCLLAVAGVAAAKHFGPINSKRWYITFAGNKCVKLTAGVTCTKGANFVNPINCTVTVVQAGITKHLQVYTQGFVGLATNCTVPLTYTRAD